MAPTMQRVSLPALIVTLLLVMLLAACGDATVVPEGAEQSVVDVVSGQTGFVPDDVSCPEGVDAEVGVTFECTFTGPEGPYTADMEITQVDGEEVIFSVRTQPSG